MKTCLEMERLPDRILPSINPPVVNPQITIFAYGVDPQTALVQTLANDYLALVPGVGAGTVVKVVQEPNLGPVTMSDVYLSVQSQLVAGAVTPGPHSLVLVELSAAPTDNLDASYHSEILSSNGGPLLPFAVVWPQNDYSIPLSHELAEASAGAEIVDPVSWQWFWLNGYKTSDFVLPDGDIYSGPPSTTTSAPPLRIPTAPIAQPVSGSPSLPQLYTLALEEYQALYYGMAARYFGDYQSLAASYQQQVADNPVANTGEGQYVIRLVDQVFMGL